MFLLDTSVLSEVLKPRLAPTVIRRLLACNTQNFENLAGLKVQNWFEA